MESLVENSNTTLSKDTKEADCLQVELKKLEMNPTKDTDLVLTTTRRLKIYGFENSRLGHESVALMSKPSLRGLTDQTLTNCILFSNKLTETVLGEAKLSEPKRAKIQDWTGVEGMNVNTKAGDPEESVPVGPPSEPAVRTRPTSGSCLSFRAKQKFSFLLAPNFLILSVSICFMAYGCSAPVVHLVPYALSLGLDHQQAAFLMAIFGVSGIVGNITFGWIMDRQ